MLFLAIISLCIFFSKKNWLLRMLRIADERITAVTDSPISQNLIELPCVSKAQVFPDFPFVIFNDC